MIPKKIHYCWFGRGAMPELANKCIESWHEQMPDYEYKLWTEDDFDISSVPYVKEAYEAKKYAFVSDYVRLWALYNEGGIYFDVDFYAYKSFDDLLDLNAFAGFEGSKHHPLMMGVVASRANGEWIKEQLDSYTNRHFIHEKGTLDMTTNVKFITANMAKNGFVQNGQEQDYKDLHVFPVDYFCPRQTTGEYLRTNNTYCEHLGLNSWSENSNGFKSMFLKLVGQKNATRLIKLKRKLFG